MKKKRICAIIAAIMLIVTCGVICVSAIDFDDVEPLWSPCCSRYVGTAEEVLGHRQYGEGCQAKIRTYCPKCDTTFDTYTGIFSNCSHTRKGDYGEID